MSRESDWEEIATQGFLSNPPGVGGARPPSARIDQGGAYAGYAPLQSLNATEVDTSATLEYTYVDKSLPYKPVVGENNPHSKDPSRTRFLVADNRGLLSLRMAGQFLRSTIMERSAAPPNPGGRPAVQTQFIPTPGRMTRSLMPKPLRRFFAPPPPEDDEEGLGYR